MSGAGHSPIAPLFRVCDGVRIRFADNKADSSAVTVLMLSPWPESLWAFRRIWDRVSGAARVVAIRVWPVGILSQRGAGGHESAEKCSNDETAHMTSPHNHRNARESPPLRALIGP